MFNPLSLIKSKWTIYTIGGVIAICAVLCGALWLKMKSAQADARNARQELQEYQVAASTKLAEVIQRNEELRKQKEKEKNDLAETHRQRVGSLRAYYDGRLRNEVRTTSGGNPMSVLPETTGGLAEATAHLRASEAFGKLQGDCAVTTQMLLDLQGWVQRQ